MDTGDVKTGDDRQQRTGVILMNMGGPETLDDVRPFLFNLFSDRQIIRLGPRFLQRPLAWLIARRRAPKSAATYAKIGGGSPITAITRQQQHALQETLSSNGAFTVFTAMRYWHPFTGEAVEQVLAAGVTEIVALSLYPHYSKATTGSSINELRKQLSATGARIPVREILFWPDHPDYIACLAELVEEGVQQFAGQPVEIVYSAHSLPVSFIEEGDPYVDHVQRTINALERLTNRRGKLCYQSRSGPVEWLSPSTPDMIERLAGQGCRAILMVPISFVSDHVETLYEIDIAYRNLAAERGIRLESTRGLNIHPRFIKALKELVLEKLAEP